MNEQPYAPSAEEVLQVVQQINPSIIQVAVQDCIIRHQAEEIERLRAQAAAFVPPVEVGVAGSDVIPAQPEPEATPEPGLRLPG
jgi:hypothetical protein